MKIVLELCLFMLCCNALCSPIRLNSDSSEDYHPCWRRGSGDQQIGFTRRYDDYKEIEILNVNNPDQRVTLDIDIPGDYAFAWSPDGSKLVFDARDDTQGNLWIYDFADSSCTQLTHYNTVGAFHPAWSPDGSQICYMRYDNITLVEVSTGNITTLISDGEENWHPTWSPDGSKVLFTSNRSGNSDLWLINSDGTGDLEQVTTSSSEDDRGKFSPDGRYIAFASDRDGDIDVWLKDLHTGNTEKIVSGSGYDSHPDWSDDGTKIAFASNRYGHFDIYYINVSEYINNEETIIEKPELFLRNYPNPFNPETKIFLNIEDTTNCELQVLNMKGEKVKLLFEGYLSRGKHEFVWSGVNEKGNKVASGTYIISFKGGNDTVNIKCMLLK